MVIRESVGKNFLADCTEQSIVAQFKDAQFLDDNSRWMRLTHEEWQRRGDGVLLSEQVNLPAVISEHPNQFKHLLRPLLRNAKHLRFLGDLGAGQIPAKEIGGLVRESPMLILVLMNSQKRPPGDGATRWMWLGMGMMIQNLLLAATALQIGTQFVSAPLERQSDRMQIRSFFDIPDSFEVMSLLRLGYVDSIEGQSVRLSPSEFVQLERYQRRSNVQNHRH